jgi:predicted adenylyl cyclase CyaB
MDSGWRFAEPEDTTVITLERILRGESSLLLVSHDLEDGSWQFLDGEHVFEDDGTVVYLGEMVQFDPSLEALADLPVGWCAWRSAPDQPWQRAEGEPANSPSPTEAGLHTAPVPATNIEIKARVVDPDRLRSAVAAMSDTEVEVLEQEDIFFAVPEGRLKLRILGEHHGELIHYHRANTAGPKTSQYHIAPTTAPGTLHTILSQVLAVTGIVRKQRSLYYIGQTRIHLDRVEGLGDYLELEVVMHADQTETEVVAIATDLMDRLGIREEQLEPLAYIDLLADSARD